MSGVLGVKVSNEKFDSRFLCRLGCSRTKAQNSFRQVTNSVLCLRNGGHVIGNFSHICRYFGSNVSMVCEKGKPQHCTCQTECVGEEEERKKLWTQNISTVG